MNVPSDDAIEAAARAINPDFPPPNYTFGWGIARDALAAALPIIREKLAREIEAEPGAWPGPGHSGSVYIAHAARIVRGEGA